MADKQPSTPPQQQPRRAQKKPVRPGPWRLVDVLDGRALRVKLEAAALNNLSDETEKRRQALNVLHTALFRGRMIAQERLSQGADGLDTARLLSAVQDEVLAALYEFSVSSIAGREVPPHGESLAVLATGGYGRGVLGPSSDIDLLIVRPRESAWSASIVEYMLYMLWDMGLKVGHAVRTPDECMKLAKDDVTIKTSLLDLRYLAGDESLATHLMARFGKELRSGNHRQFIQDKLVERNRRHLRQGATSYLVEPNLKEGKGGLRDLQTLYWITKHTYGGTTLEDVMQANIFTPHEYAVFIRSARFFWTVRCHLHFLTGRAEERISFDLQPELAMRLGYRDRGDQLGVERFMKRYFIAAKDVGTLSSILSARIAFEQGGSEPGGILGWFSGPQRRPVDDEPSFELEAGQLTFKSAEEDGVEDPVNLVRLFIVADRLGVDIHPAAMSRVMRDVRSLKPEFRLDPMITSLFLEALLDSEQPASVLRQMNEADLLGRLIPEFGAIVAQTQFNMYHHYTVDEHTLRTIETMSDLEHGRIDISQTATSQFKQIANRRALYLAMLLHDTGKGKGDQQMEGMLTARAACERFGLPKTETELVAWLVGNHLEMSEVAQKRDITDPRTVTDFARLVGGIEQLRLLYILTISDIRGVGPQVWNSWKGQLLTELFQSAATSLRDGRADETSVTAQLEDQAERARQILVDQRGAIPSRLIDMEPAYWTGFDTFQLNEQAELASSGKEIIVRARPGRKGDATTLIIMTPDRIGLFAQISGYLASRGANIVTAQVYTSMSGIVVNVYRLQDYNRRGFCADDPDRIASFEADLAKLLRGDLVVQDVSVRSERRQAAFLVQPSVKVLNDASKHHTVIDVAGRDRAGLLHELARVIVDNELNITSAHVGSYGERVFDAFYVQTANGSKLLDETLKSTLKQQLLAVLQSHEPEGPQTPARKLARAMAKDSF